MLMLALDLLPRRTALCAGVALVVAPQLPANAETVKEVVRRLDSTVSRNADGDPAEHLCEIVVGQPGFDSWCPVEISAPYVVGAEGHHIDYLWMKDARTVSTQRVFAARAFERTDPTIPRLVQNLKKGSVFRPMVYCSAHGLWEGEPITV
jgi:desulfoferrodoxin (superoxide reductase-like protein)